MSNPMQLAEKLGEAMLESEEYRAFSLARDNMNQNGEARDLAGKFRDLQQELREAQRTGRKITQVQIEELRTCQRTMAEHPAIKPYLGAKKGVENLMNAAQQVVEQVVGISPAGGGCDRGCC